MDLPGTGKPMGDNGSPGTDEYHLPIKRTNFGTRKSTYSKSISAVSECFVSGIIKSDANIYCTSELMKVEWETLASYMTPSEFELIQPGAHVTRCHVKVVFKGVTVKFETNATSTQVATLNTIQTLKAAVGLNHTGWGGQFFYSALSPTDPMRPTAVAHATLIASNGRTQSYTEELYGQDNRAGDPGCYNTGNYWIGRNYWCETSPGVGTSTNGWPTARQQKCKIFDAKTMINKTIIDETYIPKMGCIKTPLRHIRDTLPHDAGLGLNVNLQGNLVDSRVANISTATGQRKAVENTSDLNTSTMPAFVYNYPIEKCQELKQGPWGEFRPQSMPSINVGVQAMPQLSMLNYIAGSYSDLVQASAYYDIHFECDVTEYTPTHYNYTSTPNVPAGDEIFQTGTIPAYNPSNALYAGLLTNNNFLI